MGEPRDDDDERFGEMVRSAFHQTPTSPPPHPFEIWAAGAARRSARRHGRVSATVAVAVVLVLALSIPVLNHLPNGRGPSELTTSGTDDDMPGTTTSTAPSQRESQELTTATVEPPDVATPTTTSQSGPAPSDQSARPPGDLDTPTTTTIAPSGGQSRVNPENPQGTAPPPTTAPPPPEPISLASLRDAAKLRFGTDYGGATGWGGAFTVHVKPGPSALPATFQGFPVVAATYSWADLDVVLATIRSRHQDLLARGVPALDYALNEQTLVIDITVSALTSDMESKAQDVLGIGPWNLRFNTGGP